MASGASTSDIIKGALSRAGEVTNGNSQYHQAALKYISQFYLSLLSGSNEFDVDAGIAWSWAKAENPLSIIIKPFIEDGTVSMTNGSTTGTFSSAPSISVANSYLKVEGRPEFFKILTHTAGVTTFTIDVEYTDDTGSGLSYKAIPIIYDLGSEVLRLVEPGRQYKTQAVDWLGGDGKIRGMDITAMRVSFPLKNIIQSIPSYFSVIYESDSKYMIQFNSYVDKQTKVDFDYIPYPTDLTDSLDSVPVVPRDHREVLEFAGAYFILQDKNDNEGMQRYFALTQRKIQAIVKDDTKQRDKINDRFAELVPRPGQSNRFRRRFTALPDMQ